MIADAPPVGERLLVAGLPDDVLVFRLDVSGPAVASDLATLSQDERERAARFRHDRDRDRFVTTRAALRRLLGQDRGISPTAVRFTEAGRGKPVLVPDTGRRFSVAHAGGHALVALADRPVGVDIELVRPDAWDPAMAALVLSPVELAWVREHDDPDRAFFRCWTRKEAFVKLGSAGLVDGLRRLTLTPHAGIPGVLIIDDALAATDVAVACAVADARWPS
jgi:4'-phosphopantetheinyl transferase